MPGDRIEWTNIAWRSRPTHVVVSEAIRRQIALGRMQPGDQLPTERDLSQQLGIGRTTLRKAIKILVKEGMVETTLGRGGGTVVLEGTSSARSDVLLVFDQCKSAIEQAYEARLAFEPVAAELAAVRVTEDQIHSLLKTLEYPAPTVSIYHSLDSRLHTIVAEASKNPLLVDAIENSRTGFFHWANVLWLNTDWQEVRTKWGDTKWAFVTDHRQIVETIADGNPEGAHSAMAQHLSNAREQFRELLGQVFTGRSRQRNA